MSPLHLDLLLMRHGEASQEASRDHSRPLTAKGAADVSLVAQKLQHSRFFHADQSLALVSDAQRTMQTWSVLNESLSMPFVADSRFYQVQAPLSLRDLLLEHVSHHPNARRIFFIGHNPVISLFSTMLTGVSTTFAPANGQHLTSVHSNWETALQDLKTWTEVQWY